MEYLRRMIAKRILMTASPGNWVLDTYCHLMSEGVSPGEAAKALSLFVDEVLAAKTRKTERIDDTTAPMGN